MLEKLIIAYLYEISCNVKMSSSDVEVRA